MRSTGGYKSTLTNLDSGASIDLTYFQKIDFHFQPDGSQVVEASGRIFVFVYEGDDLSIFDPGLYMVTGRMSGVTGPDLFALEPEVVQGSVVDLCAQIS
jgi:hypothetical protein